MIVRDTHEFRRQWLPIVRAAARNSTCDKSRRGSAIFDGTFTMSTGFNGPPHPFKCEGRFNCGNACNKVAVHAEERALIDAGPNIIPERFDLVHLKIDEAAADCVSGQPSCWQCSRAIVAARIARVWLLHEDGWKCYTAEDFHEQTLRHCDLPTRMDRRCIGCGRLYPMVEGSYCLVCVENGEYE